MNYKHNPYLYKENLSTFLIYVLLMVFDEVGRNMVKYYKVKVKWSEPFDLSRAYIYGYDNDQLYMVLRSDPCVKNANFELVYIGQAYRQSIARRLKTHHKIETIVEETPKKKMVFVKFGTVILPEGRRISHELVTDIENALIYWHEPKYNDTSYASYNGRPIHIINQGKYEPLEKEIVLPEVE